jgi:hypothetical protein
VSHTWVYLPTAASPTVGRLQGRRASTGTRYTPAETAVAERCSSMFAPGVTSGSAMRARGPHRGPCVMRADAAGSGAKRQTNGAHRGVKGGAAVGLFQLFARKRSQRLAVQLQGALARGLLLFIHGHLQGAGGLAGKGTSARRPDERSINETMAELGRVSSIVGGALHGQRSNLWPPAGRGEEGRPWTSSGSHGRGAPLWVHVVVHSRARRSRVGRGRARRRQGDIAGRGLCSRSCGLDVLFSFATEHGIHRAGF